MLRGRHPDAGPRNVLLLWAPKQSRDHCARDRASVIMCRSQPGPMPKRKISPRYIADHIRRVLKDGGSAPHAEGVLPSSARPPGRGRPGLRGPVFNVGAQYPGKSRCLVASLLGMTSVGGGRSALGFRLSASGSRLLGSCVVETCCRAPLGRPDEGVRAYVVQCLARSSRPT
jgi:hypothetical protein